MADVHESYQVTLIGVVFSTILIVLFILIGQDCGRDAAVKNRALELCAQVPPADMSDCIKEIFPRK